MCVCVIYNIIYNIILIYININIIMTCNLCISEVIKNVRVISSYYLLSSYQLNVINSLLST